MLQKKIVMLGAFAVGKTSLVQRFVEGIYSERYLTTVGVKIDKKELEVGGTPLKLMLWDVHGEDQFQKVPTNYLRGAAGYLLVADPTRPETLETAQSLHQRARASLGEVPCLLIYNKADLVEQWQASEEQFRALENSLGVALRTSAKEGSGVEEAFAALGRKLLL